MPGTNSLCRSAEWKTGDREPHQLAEVYLSQADGDAVAALLQAIAAGRAISGLVSRGFARWGQPERRARDTGEPS